MAKRRYHKRRHSKGYKRACAPVRKTLKRKNGKCVKRGGECVTFVARIGGRRKCGKKKGYRTPAEVIAHRKAFKLAHRRCPPCTHPRHGKANCKRRGVCFKRFLKAA